MRSKYKHTHIYISNSNLALCSESITQNKYHDDDHAFSSVPSFRIGNYLKDDINIFTYEGIFCHRNGYAWHKSVNYTPNILQKYKTYTNIHININI